MICSKCGAEITVSTPNCPACGASLDNSEKTVGIWDSSAPLVQSTGSQAAVAAASAPAQSVGFGEAFGLLFRQYATFSGRATRPEFWWGFLILFLIGAVIGVLTAVFPPLALLSLGILLPSLSVTVRRLHDAGKSGHFAWLLLIPLVGAIIILVFCGQASDGDNRFGKAAGSVEAAPEAETFEERVYRLSQEHEPRNPNTPDGKAMLDQALARIIPTYSGSENLAKSIMLCNPQDIKANIEAMDRDTLLIIVKAFRQHINMGEDANTIQMVQKAVNNTLREML